MVKSKSRRERVRSKLGFFLSLAMAMQITGSLMPCRYAFAEENKELPFKNVSVSLLKNGESYDPENDYLSKKDDVTIKYEFDIASGTAIAQETNYRLKIPEQFKIKNAEFKFDDKESESRDDGDVEKVSQSNLHNDEKVTDDTENSKDNNVEKLSGDTDSSESKDISNNKPSENIDSDEQSGKTDSGDSKDIEEPQQTVEKSDKESENSVSEDDNTDTVNEQQKEIDIKNSPNDNSNDKSQDKSSIDSPNDNSVTQQEVSKKLLAGPVKNIPFNFGTITVNADNTLTITADELSAGSKIHGSLLVDSSFNEEKIGTDNPEAVTFNINKSEKCTLNMNFIENETVQNVLQAGQNSISAGDFIKGVYLSTDKYNSTDIDDVMCPLNKDFIKHNKDTYGTLSNVDIAETLYVCYLFKIPGDSNIKSGDQVKIKIPEEFLSPVKTDKLMCLAEAEDESKEIEIGKIQYTSNHDVIITFNDNIETTEYDLKGAEGFFWFGRGLDKDKLAGTTTKTIDFNVDTEIKNTYKIDFKEDEPEKIKPSVDKKGEYIQKDQEILWTITVNAGSDDIVNYELYDDISADKDKHTFIRDSLKIDNPSGDESIIEMSGTLLRYNLGTIKAGKSKIITYRTKPADSIANSQGVANEIKNLVQLKDSSSPDAKVIAEKEDKIVIKNSFIFKKGKYNKEKQRIDWTININQSKAELENVVIEDNIDEITSNSSEFKTSDLKLDINSIKVIRDSDKADVTKTEGSTNGSSERKLIYTFNKGIISDSYTITFSTKLEEPLLIGKNIKLNNKVKLTTSNYPEFTYDATGIGIETKQDMLTKKALGYDKNTKEITWEITVNSIKASIKNGRIIEKISKNQELVEVRRMDSNTTITPVLKGINANGTKEYYIDIGDINDKCVVIVKTRIIDDSIIWANQEVRDKVSNTCTFENDGKAKFEAAGRIPINSKVIEKSGSYNYSDRTLTWTVRINKSNTPLHKAVFIDEIEKGQKYVENSFSIKSIKGDDGKYLNDQNEETEVLKENSQYIPNDADDLYKGGKLSFVFPGGIINNAYEIQYKTEISDDYFSLDENGNAKNGNFKVHNKGEINIVDNDIPRKLYAEKDVEIKNYMIDKDFKYTKNNDFITWEIYVNRNNVALKDVSIIDKIDEGLQVDMSSVKLYEIHFDKDGKIDNSKTVKVDSSEYCAAYNAETREVEIKYAKDKTDSNTYMIMFDTDVEKTGTYTNSVRFNSIAQKEYTDTSSEVCVVWEDSGSGSLVSLGSLKIRKEDKEGNPLPGAQFELLRVKDGIEESLGVSSETGVDGIVQFRRLSIEDGRNSYIIREIKAPDGYNKAADQSITLTSQNKKADIVFQDEKIPPKDDPKGGGGGSHHHHYSNDSDDDDDKDIDESQNNDNNTVPDEPQNNPIDNNPQVTPGNTETNPNNVAPIISSGDKPNSTGPVETKNKPQEKPSDNKSSNRKNKRARLPQAGRMFDTKVIMGLGIIMIFAGLIIMIRRKHMKKNNCK